MSELKQIGAPPGAAAQPRAGEIKKKPGIVEGGRDAHVKEDRHRKKKQGKKADLVKQRRSQAKVAKPRRRQRDHGKGYPSNDLGDGPECCSMGEECRIAGHSHRKKFPSKGYARRAGEKNGKDGNNNKRKGKLHPCPTPQACACGHRGEMYADHWHSSDQTLQSAASISLLRDQALKFERSERSKTERINAEVLDSLGLSEQDFDPWGPQPSHLWSWTPEEAAATEAKAEEEEKDEPATTPTTGDYIDVDALLSAAHAARRGVVAADGDKQAMVPEQAAEEEKEAKVMMTKSPAPSGAPLSKAPPVGATDLIQDENLDRESGHPDESGDEAFALGVMEIENRVVFFNGELNDSPLTRRERLVDWFGRHLGTHKMEYLLNNEEEAAVSEEVKGVVNREPVWQIRLFGRALYTRTRRDKTHTANAQNRWSHGVQAPIFTALLKVLRRDSTLLRRRAIDNSGKSFEAFITAVDQVAKEHEWYSLWSTKMDVVLNTLIYYINQRTLEASRLMSAVSDKPSLDFQNSAPFSTSQNVEPYSASEQPRHRPPSSKGSSTTVRSM